MTREDGLCLNNLVTSSDNLVSASSGSGQTTCLESWSASTERCSLQYLSLLSPSQARLCSHALSDPPPAQGCPLHMPEGKNGLTAVSASCNTVWLNIYSAAAGLRLWMDDMSNTDTSLWNSIFIFIALAGPGVCVFPPRSSFINTFKQLQLQLKTHLDSCSYSSVFVLILFSF